MPTPEDTPDTTLTEPIVQKTEPVSSGQPVDWEKRYKGLQIAYDKLQKKLENAEGQLATALAEDEELKTKTRAHETEKGNFTTQLSAHQQKIADLEREVASHKMSGERMKLIMAEFPDLATFEAKGLLPPAETIDALKPKLEEFRATLGASIDGSVRERIKGSGPTGGSGSGTGTTRSKETIYAELTHLAGRADPESRAKYDTLIREWDEAQKK